MIRIFILHIALFIFTTSIKAQNNFSYVLDFNINVVQNNVELKNAWAGGMNFMQFETFDFNKDGINDILAFDKSGNKIIPFVKQSDKQIADYKYAPEYVKYFPEVMNWIKLVDYNCDGKKDIFAYNILGIEVWKNESTENNITFTKQTFKYNTPSGIIERDAIKTNVGSEYDSNLTIIYQDIPIIADVDNNGSIDVLNFGLSSAIPQGSTIEFHKNASACGLNFTRETSCWGNFAENYINNSISLDVCNTNKALPKNNKTKMHAGSSLLAYDFSGNGLVDILIGDISFNNATLIFNNGSINNADMTYMDAEFPSYSTPIDLQYFPGFSLIDIANDNILDLIASPTINGSENINSVWWYKNSSKTNHNSFKLENKAFLQDEMIDVGEGSKPTLTDINNDNIIDLLVSNYGYFKQNNNYSSMISVYINIGTTTKPKFELQNTDYGNLSEYKWTNIKPTFADLNNNGLKDAIIGEANGLIHLFNGTNNSELEIAKFKYLDIDVGNSATPLLVDLNNNGLFDLLIGNQKGDLYYLKNTGTKTTPYFKLITKNFGGINLNNNKTPNGSSYPEIVNHPDLGKILTIGNRKGTIKAYKILVINNKISTELVSNNLFNFDFGEFSTITSADLFNNNNPVIIVGNQSGGLSVLKEEKSFECTKSDNELVVYPNPVINSKYIYYCVNAEIRSIEVYNIIGKNQNIKVLSEKINIEKLTPGIYTLKVFLENGTFLSDNFIVIK
ncbi:MAG: T9SS type A sorting domain-containing protein [Ichthyobacteriaceae bacterium]|nr:T9SS type A sorting domain-containing protein [Ichthyobacteriaceae bacterium]